MPELYPYLNFRGDCREALQFYKACLGGDVTVMTHWRDFPNQDVVPEGFGDHVMHAEFRAGNASFMATDCLPQVAVIQGTHLNLSLAFATYEEQTLAFDKLAEGGHVIMPLADQFWGARFGMLLDKYGFTWLLKCEQKQAAAAQA